MAQVPPSEVPGMPDPALVAQLRQISAMGTALPNNPLGGAFTYNATYNWMETSYGGSTFAALPTDGSGNVSAKVINQTGSLASLLALAGSQGQVAVPTDVPGVVRYTGVAGKAQLISPYAGVGLFTLTPTDTALTVDPVNEYLVFQSSDTTARDITLTINAGYFIGQRIVIAPRCTTSLDVGVTVTLAGGIAGDYINNIAPGMETTCFWNGTSWIPFATRQVETFAASKDFFAYGGGTAPAKFAGAIGYCATAQREGAIAISGPNYDFNSSVTSKTPYEFAFGFGKNGINDGSVVFASLSTSTSAAGTKEITLDGGTGSAANRIRLDAASVITVVRAKIRLFGRDGTATVTYSREFDAYLKVTGISDTITVLGALTAVGTEYNVGMTAVPTLALTTSTNNLIFNVTHSQAAAFNWRIVAEFIRVH